MFDVIVAQCQCSDREPGVIEGQIQTHLREAADGSELRIGFRFDGVDVTTDSIVDAGYVLVRSPTADEPIRLLDVWSWPLCCADTWAQVEIRDDTLFGVDPVTMNRGTLESAHFISEVNAEWLAESLIGHRPASGADSVRILMGHLPAI